MKLEHAFLKEEIYKYGYEYEDEEDEDTKRIYIDPEFVYENHARFSDHVISFYKNINSFKKMFENPYYEYFMKNKTDDDIPSYMFESACGEFKYFHQNMILRQHELNLNEVFDRGFDGPFFESKNKLESSRYEDFIQCYPDTDKKDFIFAISLIKRFMFASMMDIGGRITHDYSQYRDLIDDITTFFNPSKKSARSAV